MRLLEDVARRGELLTAVVDEGRRDVVEALEAACVDFFFQKPDIRPFCDLGCTNSQVV
jgi:hypothetical protein